MATLVQPKLIDYNGKQYDYSALKENVYKNYDTYARRFGYGRSKYDKDRQGLAEILGQLEAGNGTIQPDQIVFNSAWGDEKGSFGKARNKSRHYRNPTWMIIDTLQGMTPYDANAGKKKLNQSLLNQELSTALAGISGLTYEGNKLKAQQEAIQNIINKYGGENLPEGYILDDGFDLPAYITKLNGVLTALGTSDRDDDDEYAYYALGLANPNKPKEKPEDKGVSAFIKSARDFGITEAMMRDDALSELYYKQKVPTMLKSFFEQQGLTYTEPQQQQSSRSSSAGVSAGSSQGQQRQQQQTKKQTQKQTQKNPPPKKPDLSKLKVGDQYIIDGHRWVITRSGEPKEITNDDSKWRKDRLVKLNKNGDKLNYVKNIRKYQAGRNINKLSDITQMVGAGLSLVPNAGAKTLGRLLLIGGTAGNVGSDLYNAYDNYNDGINPSSQIARSAADAVTGIALTRGTKTPGKELKDLYAQKTKFSPQQLSEAEAAELKELQAWRGKGELHTKKAYSKLTPEQKQAYDQKKARLDQLKTMVSGNPAQLKSVEERIAELEAKADPRSNTFVAPYKEGNPYIYSGPSKKALLTAGGAQVIGSGTIPMFLGEEPAYSAEQTAWGMGPVGIRSLGSVNLPKVPKFDVKGFWNKALNQGTGAVAAIPLLLASQAADAAENDNVTYMDDPVQIMPYAFSRNPGQTITGLNGVEHTVKGFKNNWEGFPVTVDTEGKEYYPMLDELEVIGDKNKSKGPTQAAKDLENFFLGMTMAPTMLGAGTTNLALLGLGNALNTYSNHLQLNQAEDLVNRINILKEKYNR